MSTNDKLRDGIDRDELAGLIRMLPAGSKLRISRNLLLVESQDGRLGVFNFGGARLSTIDHAIEIANAERARNDETSGNESGGERDWEIWSEGYRSGDGEGLASLIGTGRGRTFKAAVLDYYRRNPTPHFNPDTLTDWCCRLFPTKDEASCSFG